MISWLDQALSWIFLVFLHVRHRWEATSVCPDNWTGSYSLYYIMVATEHGIPCCASNNFLPISPCPSFSNVTSIGIILIIWIKECRVFRHSSFDKEHVFLLRSQVCGGCQSRAKAGETYWDLRIWRVWLPFWGYMVDVGVCLLTISLDLFERGSFTVFNMFWLFWLGVWIGWITILASLDAAFLIYSSCPFCRKVCTAALQRLHFHKVLRTPFLFGSDSVANSLKLVIEHL